MSSVLLQINSSFPYCREFSLGMFHVYRFFHFSYWSLTSLLGVVWSYLYHHSTLLKRRKECFVYIWIGPWLLYDSSNYPPKNGHFFQIFLVTDVFTLNVSHFQIIIKYKLSTLKHVHTFNLIYDIDSSIRRPGEEIMNF